MGIQFPSRKRWTKAEKWLFGAPALVGLFALALGRGPDFVRQRMGWPRQLETAPGTFLLETVISRQGNVLAAAGHSLNHKSNIAGAIYCWDAHTLKPLPTLYPQGREVGVSCALSLSPDGKSVGASRSDNRYSLYDVATQHLLWRREYADTAEFSPDGKWIAFHCYKDNVQIVSAANGRLIRQLPTKAGQFVAWAPDGKTLACSGPKIEIRRPYESTVTTGIFIELWDVTNGRKIRTFPSELTRSVHFSPDGKTLLAVGYSNKYKTTETWGGRVRLFSTNTGRLQWEKGTKFCEAVFSPDGRVIAALQHPKIGLDEKRFVLLLDPQTGSVKHSLSFRPRCYALDAPSALVFSSDGKRLFVRGDQSIFVWDLE